MQTEADLPPVTELPIEESSSVTGSTLVEEEEMTVKEEAEPEDEEAQHHGLCDSPVLPPGEASTGIEHDLMEPGSDDFSPTIQQSPTSIMSPPAECSPQGQEEQQQVKSERGRGRGRRRSRWKLKFHHQALPPEYLDHYEASIAQQEANKNSSIKAEHLRANMKTNQSLLSRSDKAYNKQNSGEKSKTSAEKPGSDKSMKSPVHSLPVKIESDSAAMQFAPALPTAGPLILNTGVTPMDQLRLIPLQTLGLGGGDSDLMTRLQNDFQRNNCDDEVSIITEHKTTPSQNGDKSTQQNKGLLGCLLANNQQSERSIPPADNSKRRSSVIMSSSSANSTSRAATPSTSQHNPPPTTSKVMKYQDLPYMGEITLDNMKPRRGRKPKKADICHLIYKNYGTIFPGAPNNASMIETEEHNANKRKAENAQQMKMRPENSHPISSGIKCRAIESLRDSSTPINHADVQSRIISSLLEKRLTAAASQQEAQRKLFQNAQDFNYGGAWSKRNIPVPPATPPPCPSAPPPSTCNDEPLNLCVKDLNQLKIRLLRKHGNFYEPRSSTATTNNTNNSIKPPASPISIKSEPNNNSSSSDLEDLLDISDDSPKFPSTPEESRNQTPVRPVSGVTEPFPQNIAGLSFPSPNEFQQSGTTLPGGYVYWPGAGVFVHPMALQSQLLYYQKMGAIPLVSMSPTEQTMSGQTFIPTTPLPIPHLTTPTIPLPQQPNVSKSSQSKPDQKPPANSHGTRNVLPKSSFNSLLNQSTGKPSGVMPSELTFPRMKRLAPLGNPPPAAGTPGTKRKRSAIFIPPMPSENNTNPTTEVSICKFKFTGGAKPSLQEKKMLSVDSGGNFRYYSGTGDKSMRGYEFFPRESLQQPAGSTGGTPSEHFLAAASSAMVGSDKMPLPNNILRESAPTPGFPMEEHRKYLSAGGNTSDMKNISSPLCDINQSPTTSAEMDSSRKPSDGRSAYFDQQGIKKKCESDDRLDCDHVESGDHNQLESSSKHFRLQGRKRKTRKSLAREKLEKTFKEKGFLIQTQQLESAEGATYCKFRQLTKFTRYLFRSWKDYLPGNVREMSVAAGVSAPNEGSPTPPKDPELEGDLSSNPPTPTSTTQSTLIEETSQHPPST